MILYHLVAHLQGIWGLESLASTLIDITRLLLLLCYVISVETLQRNDNTPLCLMALVRVEHLIAMLTCILLLLHARDPAHRK